MAVFTVKTIWQHIFGVTNYGSASLTPGALTAGIVNTANTIAVPGAAIGDVVDVAAPAALVGTIMQGEVTAAGVVTIKFLSGATPTPPAGIYRVTTYPYGADFLA